MAPSKILVALAIFAFAFPSSMAVDWNVGDDSGWNLGVNYTEWAAGKTFSIGDTLVFKYKVGIHNVVKVNGTEFTDCTVPSNSVPKTSGNDSIPLTTTGKHWYICGIPEHCPGGMRLVVTVSELSPAGSPTATPPPSSGETAPPPSAATGIAFSKCLAWFAGVFSILLMIMA